MSQSPRPCESMTAENRYWRSMTHLCRRIWHLLRSLHDSNITGGKGCHGHHGCSGWVPFIRVGGGHRNFLSGSKMTLRSYIKKAASGPFYSSNPPTQCGTATAESLSSGGGFWTESFNTDSSKVDSGKATSCVKAAVREFPGKIDVRVKLHGWLKVNPSKMDSKGNPNHGRCPESSLFHWHVYIHIYWKKKKLHISLPQMKKKITFVTVQLWRFYLTVFCTAVISSREITRLVLPTYFVDPSSLICIAHFCFNTPPLATHGIRI